jgi:hypothetical protein
MRIIPGRTSRDRLIDSFVVNAGDWTEANLGTGIKTRVGSKKRFLGH